jgi:hypothetical protein
MNRRTCSRRRLLAGGFALGGVALTGCIGDGEPTRVTDSGRATRTPESVGATTTTERTTETDSADTTVERSDASGTETGDSLPADLRQDDGALRVDVDGLVGDDATLDRAAGVSYTDPIEQSFRVNGFYRGMTVLGGVAPDRRGAAQPLVAGPEMTPDDGALNAYVLPVYDEKTFDYHVYADREFLDELATPRLVWNGGGAARGMREATLEEIHPGIYRDVLETAEEIDPRVGPMTLVFGDATIEDFETDRIDDRVIVLLEPTGTPSRSSAPPSASFSVEMTGGEVTVLHDGGDAVDASNLTIEVDGESAATGFLGTVAPGDSVTLVDVPSDAEVSVTWYDGDESLVLARFVT